MRARVESIGYEELFGLNTETLEAEKQGIADLAFRMHLGRLGEFRYKDIDYLGGNTDVSVPAYFAGVAASSLSRFKTITNTVALAALPAQYSRNPGSPDLEISRKVLFESSRRDNSVEDAIRHGAGAEWLVGQTTRATGEPYTDQGQVLASEVVRGLNASIVMPLPIMATRVREAGYRDFLDYLKDARQQLGSIVETIFEYGPPKPGE